MSKLESIRAEIEPALKQLPEHLRKGLRGHILFGTPTGDFLLAWLSNDLREAVGRADDEALPALREIVGFLNWHAPGGSWGSPHAVADWRARGGVAGLGAA